MHRYWVIAVALAVFAIGCGDDDEAANNGANNGINNGIAINNGEFGSKWEAAFDGEDPVKGTLITTSGSDSLLNIQLGVPVGASGTIQLTIDGIAPGETGTWRDEVTTQIVGLPGAENCGATSGGTEGAPTEITIELNEEKHFKGSFTITDMTCANDAAAISGAGTFERKSR